MLVAVAVKPTALWAGGAAELDAQLRVEREANRAWIRRHPLDDALRTSEAPQKPALSAGVERLWPGRFTSQNENAQSLGLQRTYFLRLMKDFEINIPPE